jgi:hypothetical protein
MIGELALVMLTQAVSSYLGVRTLHAALGPSRARFVLAAVISDSVKFGVYTWVAVIAVRGSALGIAAAVLGGALGNALVHRANQAR